MRIHPLLALGEISTNKSCTSIIENERCTSDCTSLLTDCAIQCDGDSVCTSSCNREFSHCSDLCPCNKKCNDGCPCPFSSQYCSSVSGIHLLAFNPFMVPNEEYRQFKFSWYKTSEQVYDLSHHVTTPSEFDDDRSWMCSFQLRRGFELILLNLLSDQLRTLLLVFNLSRSLT